MAKKVILKDQNNIEILPITRGELILDSSGKEAFHSSDFLATQSQPGLMSATDKYKIDNLESVTLSEYLKSATVTDNKLTLIKQDNTQINFYDNYRPISINGTSILENNNTALNLVAGTNISLNSEKDTSNNYTGKVLVTASDSKVTQTIDDTTDSEYSILFSETDDDATHTEGSRKSSRLKYNPSKNYLSSGQFVAQDFILNNSSIKTILDTLQSEINSVANKTNFKHLVAEQLDSNVISSEYFYTNNFISDSITANQVNTYLINSSGVLTLNATNSIYLKYANNDAKSVVLNGTEFKPFDTANGLIDLGASDARWKNIYGITGDFSNVILKGNSLSEILDTLQSEINSVANKTNYKHLVTEQLDSDVISSKAIYADSITATTFKGTVDGLATSIQCSAGSSDAYRSIVVTPGNNTIFYNTKITANYATGDLKAVSFTGNLDWSYITNKPSSFTPSTHNHPTSQINLLTGYSKATSASALATTDTLNTALGKLEYKADLGKTAYDWYKSVTGTDNDDVINKWGEIVDFIDSVAEGTDITDEFVTRKTDQTITGIKTFSNKIKFLPVADTDIGASIYSEVVSGATNLVFFNTDDFNDGFIFRSKQYNNETDTDVLTILYSGIKSNSSITAPKFITSGGTSSQFVKGDGSLDSTSYATTSSLVSYLPLSGGTMKQGAMIKWTESEDFYDWVSNPGQGFKILRYSTKVTPKQYSCGIHVGDGYYSLQFVYDVSAHYLKHRQASIDKDFSNSTWKWILDDSNYSNYLPFLNSTSTHATNTSVIYAPTTAGTSDQILSSNGSGAPTWINTSTLVSGKTKVLDNYYSTRPSSLNIQFSDGGIRNFKKTSSTTEGNCSGHGHILHSSWDNNGGFDWQLAMINADMSTFGLEFRGQNGGTWTEWHKVITDLNYTSYLGYIGTTAVQKSSAVQALTGITNATMSGLTTTSTLKITSTSAVAHIAFSRGNYNYITAPASGSIGFCVNGNAAGTGANCEMVISDGTIFPGTTNVTSLGDTSHYWTGVYAHGFYKNGSSNSYVLLGGGSHKALSDFLLESELAAQELTANLTTITKTLTVTQAWMDTGIKYQDLPATGTYIVQVSSHMTNNLVWYGYWSGVMSWYRDTTNSAESDEILLHRASHTMNGNTIYLRTITTASSDGRHLRLQIAANKDLASASYTFKFKRII